MPHCSVDSFRISVSLLIFFFFSSSRSAHWCQWGVLMSVILLLLSCFSRVRLRATPEMAAHQASPSLGLSRQEHWSGLPFPSPMHESEKWKWNHSVMSDSSNPMDCSPPGSSIHGIFQAKVLEWGAIALSSQWSYYYCIPITMCSPFFFLLAFVLCIWMLLYWVHIS